MSLFESRQLAQQFYRVSRNQDRPQFHQLELEHVSVLSGSAYQKVNADKRRLVDAFDLVYKLQGRLFFPRDHLGCHLGYAR